METVDVATDALDPLVVITLDEPVIAVDVDSLNTGLEAGAAKPAPAAVPGTPCPEPTPEDDVDGAVCAPGGSLTFRLAAASAIGRGINEKGTG